MGRQRLSYLLDTHVTLWALTDPTRLGPAAREVIENPSSRLVVSAVSAWEIATKQRLGKLPQADVLLGAYAKHLDRLGVVRLAMTEDHALLAGRLEWNHRDPFDRMLAAQAMIESLVIITGDPALADCPGVPTLW
ncbi:MAG: type II toxin-antitoxin system VapC family toxin [Mycobacterium sp.]|nr:type II toxin-antitoxin system VapC family toxin [Mycobacterium sp.]